jgi:arylformamidase
MSPLDPAWLDSMYNNRTLVPDHASYFARWVQESSVARGRLPGELDLSYGPSAGEKLDIFPAAGFSGQPSSSPVPGHGAPVLLFVHGGYWRALDKSDHSFLAAPFTAAGACVVIPNYTLSPTASVAEILMQMVKAVAWTWRHVADYGGDPKRITVAGHSVGGYMVAMLLNCVWNRYEADLPPALVKTALSMSGLYDLEPLRQAPFLRSVGLTPQDVARGNPVDLPRPAQGKLYSVAGADESSEFMRQNLLIQQAWGEKTVPVCEAHLGLNHFSIVDALGQPAHRLHKLALDLLGLGKTGPA